MPSYANPYSDLFTAVRDALRNESGPFDSDDKCVLFAPISDELIGLAVEQEIVNRLSGEGARCLITPSATQIAPDLVGDGATPLETTMSLWLGVSGPIPRDDCEVGLLGNDDYWGIFPVMHYVEDKILYPRLSVAGWDGAMTPGTQTWVPTDKSGLLVMVYDWNAKRIHEATD